MHIGLIKYFGLSRLNPKLFSFVFNEVIISLGVKTNNEVDELMHKVEALGGR